MARAKRTDNKGRVLRNGESQNKKDGRYCYRWTEPVTGKRGTVYALSLVELREKEQQIQKDIQDGINTNSANMTLNQLFNIYMDGKANIRESTRCNYENDWNISVKQSILGDMKPEAAVSAIRSPFLSQWALKMLLEIVPVFISMKHRSTV